MAKNKISEWSSTPANNTDIANIDIAEGCAPSGVNNAIREMMAQVKDMQTGADGDNFTVGGNLSVNNDSVFTGTVLVGETLTSVGVITASAGFSGNLTGNVTGNVTGNLTGNVTGNVTGSSGSTTGNAATVTNGVYTTNFSGSNQSLSSSGYQKIPGGLILQWGITALIEVDASLTVTLPIAFTNAMFVAIVSAYNTNSTLTGGPAMISKDYSTSSFVITNDDRAAQATWFAIGY